MEITDRIRQDHDRLRDLTGRLRDAAPGGRVELFDEFRRRLWAHGRVEEAVFYAPLRHAKATRGEVLEGLNEHHMIDGLVAELLAMPPDSDAWTAKFQVLGELLEHHLDEEEEELFEEAREVLSEDQSRRMAEEWRRRLDGVADALVPLPRE